MPLPLILGVGAAIAAVGGAGSGIHGAVKMKEANDTMRWAKSIQENAIYKLEKENKFTENLLDEIGKQEMSILSSFDRFSDIIEKIQGRPEFKEYRKDGVEIPPYKPEELKNVSAAAGILLGGLGGAASGTAGGIAAAGAVQIAVTAFGTASTGTAISTLSGAALSNATLAALGGGALSAGGGGIALGTTILGATTAGVGLLVGGVIFNMVGSSLSDKADEAYWQARKTEKEVEESCQYLSKLGSYADRFRRSLFIVEHCYRGHLEKLDRIVMKDGKNQWSAFTAEEKKITENLVLLVGLLYKMCQVKLLLEEENEKKQKMVNVRGIMDIESDAEQVVRDRIIA